MSSSLDRRSNPLYSIGVWDCDLQSYAPVDFMECVNIPRAQLVAVMRYLQTIGYTCHRFGNTTHDLRDSDCSVLIERTDGKPLAAILKDWER